VRAVRASLVAQRGQARRPRLGRRESRGAGSSLARARRGGAGQGRRGGLGLRSLGRLESGSKGLSVAGAGARLDASGARLGRLGSSASVGILHGGCEQEGEKGGERRRSSGSGG
jgi:hypothetical protein